MSEYYSRSDDPNSRAVQTIFRRLKKSGLLIKCKKTDLICNANKKYEVTYRIPFIVSQQKLNDNFIKLNDEIIQLKSELHKRSIEYLKNKNRDVESKETDKAVNAILSNVIGQINNKLRLEFYIFKVSIVGFPLTDFSLLSTIMKSG